MLNLESGNITPRNVLETDVINLTISFEQFIYGQNFTQDKLYNYNERLLLFTAKIFTQFKTSIINTYIVIHLHINLTQ